MTLLNFYEMKSVNFSLKTLVIVENENRLIIAVFCGLSFQQYAVLFISIKTYQKKLAYY